MSDFEKYIEAKYPNRSPKILFQKFKDIDGTLFYGIKEVEDQAEAWNHQQAIIDEHTEVIKIQDADLRKYEKQIESLKTQLAVYKEDMAKDAEKIAELTNKIEKPCRWCGFENKRGAND